MKFFVTSKISENMHKTPEGYLVCVAVPIARTGEMLYMAGETPLEADESGKVIVYREAAEVFRPETIASFEGKAITVTHPEDFVSPENWKELSKGSMQNVRRGSGAEENDLVADLMITDSEAIKKVEDGLREVSCGYEAEYQQLGIGRGRQIKIIGNHLALVEQGRAGSTYAIKDHKGKGSPMKLSDKIKAIFANAEKEALKVAGETADSVNTETPENKSGFLSVDDFNSYMDGFKKEMKDWFGKGDASSQPTATTPAEVVAKDDDPMKSMDERMKKMEDAFEKMNKSDDADPEESEDEDGEESEDDMEGEMVGDSASRIEILAPGMKAKGKDAKGKALIAAYATKDGKAVIDALTGGKKPNVKDEAQVDNLFVAVSEILKERRAGSLARTRTTDEFQTNLGQPKGAMTPEQMNEINKKHYEQKSA